MGTGKNVLTNATSTIPPSVTGACSAVWGIVSTASAPSTAASNINGTPTRATCQKLFAYDVAVVPSACAHVSERGTSIAHSPAVIGPAFHRATSGANTKIISNIVASFNPTTGSGNNANAIASTTTFSVGELNIAASVDSVLIPDAYSPRPIGATQFAQTPSGMPTAAPSRELTYAFPVRRRGIVASTVSAAAPKKNPNVMPISLACSQLFDARPTRWPSGIPAVTGNTVPNVIAPFTLTCVPAEYFL